MHLLQWKRLDSRIKMIEKHIRIDDYGRFQDVHDQIISLLNAADVSVYVAIGILESIKQEIFLENAEETSS